MGLLPVWPGLIHSVALPRLGTAHDLAVLLVVTSGWPAFIGGAIVSLFVRSALLAAMTGGLSVATLGRAALFHLVAWPGAFLASASGYAAGALLFYGLFWLGVMLTLLLVLVLGPLPWLGTGWRRALGRSARSGFRFGTIGAYLVLITVLGVLADAAGRAAIALVPVSAVLTWSAAWVLAHPERVVVVRRTLGMVTGATIALLAGIVVLGPDQPPTGPPLETRRDR